MLDYTGIIALGSKFKPIMMSCFCFVFMYLVSCNNIESTDQSANDEFPTRLDSIKYENYSEAVKRQGTLNFFIVIKVKDLNTNVTREICTKGNFLMGALTREYNIVNDSAGIDSLYEIALANKTRYFEFADTSALNNLGLDNYSDADFKEFEQSNSIDSLILEIKDKKWEKWIPEDKDMLLYAHALFNRGILTGEYDCFGGTLHYIDNEWLKRMRTPIEVIE